jgi:hypothetical protein
MTVGVTIVFYFVHEEFHWKGAKAETIQVEGGIRNTKSLITNSGQRSCSQQDVPGPQVNLGNKFGDDTIALFFRAAK